MDIDIGKDKYIIVEIIPTHSNKKVGELAQISALKIDGLKLISRFDYRLKDDLIKNEDIKRIISYDNKSFHYVDSSKKLFSAFKKYIGSRPLLIIDNNYTKEYLASLKNKKISVFKFLNLDFSEDIFPLLIKKYHLEPSNHLVDLLYESLLFEYSDN